MTIKLEDCTPDQVFEGTVDGRRVTLRRNRPSSAYPWNAMSIDRGSEAYYSDDEISDPVPLVPARPITWADIPRELPWGVECAGGESPVLDRLTDLQRRHIAARINTRGGIPTTAPAEADPIVEAITESDLAAVGVTKADGCWKLKNGRGLESVPYRHSVEALNESIKFLLARAAAFLAVKRAIEAEEKVEKAAARNEWTTTLFGDSALYFELGDRERGLVDRAIAKAGGQS